MVQIRSLQTQPDKQLNDHHELREGLKLAEEKGVEQAFLNNWKWLKSSTIGMTEASYSTHIVRISTPNSRHANDVCKEGREDSFL